MSLSHSEIQGHRHQQMGNGRSKVSYCLVNMDIDKSFKHKNHSILKIMVDIIIVMAPTVRQFVYQRRQVVEERMFHGRLGRYSLVWWHLCQLQCQRLCVGEIRDAGHETHDRMWPVANQFCCQNNYKTNTYLLIKKKMQE